MKIVAITQARVGSTRLPGKILMEVNGVSLLRIHLERILKSKKIDMLLVATTISEEDKSIVDIANSLGLKVYSGSVNDVLDRFYQATNTVSIPDYIVRLTSDCPLIDAELIDKIINFSIQNNLDYCSNTLNPQYPDGQDIEVFRFSALKQAWEEARLSSEREHVTPYIWKNSSYNGGSLFTSDNFEEGYSYGQLRMTVDEQKDFEVISKVIVELGVERTWLDYAHYLEKNLELKSINENITRNEGYNKSINREK